MAEEDMFDQFGEESDTPIDDDDDDGFGDIEAQPVTRPDRQDSEEYPFEVLSAEDIVKFMVECIKEVTNVVQVCYKVCIILVLTLLKPLMKG